MQVHQGNDWLPTGHALRVKAAAVRRGELQKAFGRLGRLSEVERQTVVALATAITDGLLSHPLNRLAGDGAGNYDGVLRDLFGLDASISPE